MANTITTQTIQNGPRNLVVKVSVEGDNSGDESATQLIDVSAFGITGVRIEKIEGGLGGFQCTLLWDADTDVRAITLPSGDFSMDFRSSGGIPNNAGAGKTGDIMLSTDGLGLECGDFVLWMVKR